MSYFCTTQARRANRKDSCPGCWKKDLDLWIKGRYVDWWSQEWYRSEVPIIFLNWRWSWGGYFQIYLFTPREHTSHRCSPSCTWFQNRQHIAVLLDDASYCFCTSAVVGPASTPCVPYVISDARPVQKRPSCQRWFDYGASNLILLVQEPWYPWKPQFV